MESIQDEVFVRNSNEIPTKMETRQDEVIVENVVYTWQKLVRRQSTKFRTLADNIVLPKNERFSRSISQANRTEMQNIGTETQNIGTETQNIGTETHICVDEQECNKERGEHFPIFMIGISVVQIILFYTCDEDSLTMKLGYDPYRRHEVWRFLTSMLVHSGYAHLWGNVVMQLVLGVFLEIVHEWKRIAIIYLASVFGGSLCITVLDSTSYCVGASGGVMGLLFSHLATILLNWNEMDRKFARFFCVTLYIVYDVSTNVYSEFYLEGNSNTSHADHFGGAVTGFLMSILVLKNFKKLPWEDTMQKICVGILITLVVITFAINAIGLNYPTTEWNFDYAKSYYGDDDDDDDVDNTATEAYGDDK